MQDHLARMMKRTIPLKIWCSPPFQLVRVQLNEIIFYPCHFNQSTNYYVSLSTEPTDGLTWTLALKDHKMELDHHSEYHKTHLWQLSHSILLFKATCLPTHPLHYGTRPTMTTLCSVHFAPPGITLWAQQLLCSMERPPTGATLF